MNALFARRARLREGWRDDVLLEWSPDGWLLSVKANAAPPAGVEIAAAVIPGMPNLHCHAFQRAMAGLTEYRSRPDDSFWSWRELMYDFAQKITPELMYAIARQLYIEMLAAGYTSVCEFHYIHHDRGGAPYGNPGEMAEAILSAARDTGIGMTFLPVLYQYSGFGSQPLRPEQRRFGASPEWILALIDRLARAHPPVGSLRYGVAPHSMRAVSPESLRAIVDGARSIDAVMPVHIHIAEQIAEVEACLASMSARPVDWLLDHFDVDEQWCLVHATHMTESEVARAARSRTVAGICPVTEANLGDGIFNAPDYFTAGGRWGIGSDSNITVSAAEELRLLEYAQRLRLKRRNVLASLEQASVGEEVYSSAVEGGAAASGRKINGIAAGQRADFLVLDDRHPSLAARAPNRLLDGLIFANDGGAAIRDVFAGGKKRISERRHADADNASREYVAALRKLIA